MAAQVPGEISPYLRSSEKRALDLGLVASVGSVALMACSVAATVISAQNKGPLLYAHERFGRNGGLFAMRKLRTLEGEVPLIGARLVRKLGIDEAPQFVHVAKGEMSVVGPRPLSPQLRNSMYQRLRAHGDSTTPNADAWMSLRSEALPGITGPTQVSCTAHARGSLDLVMQFAQEESRYLQEASLRTDVRIIGKTPVAALVRKNYMPNGSQVATELTSAHPSLAGAQVREES